MQLNGKTTVNKQIVEIVSPRSYSDGEFRCVQVTRLTGYRSAIKTGLVTVPLILLVASCESREGVEEVALIEAAATEFRWELAHAGDLDGDGVPDVLVCQPGFEDHRGRVLIVGAKDGEVLREARGRAIGERFGARVGNSRDLDGDGLPEFSVLSAAGEAFVLSGQTLEVLYSVRLGKPHITESHAVALCDPKGASSGGTLICLTAGPGGMSLQKHSLDGQVVRVLESKENGGSYVGLWVDPIPVGNPVYFAAVGGEDGWRLTKHTGQEVEFSVDFPVTLVSSSSDLRGLGGDLDGDGNQDLTLGRGDGLVISGRTGKALLQLEGSGACYGTYLSERRGQREIIAIGIGVGGTRLCRYDVVSQKVVGVTAGFGFLNLEVLSPAEPFDWQSSSLHIMTTQRDAEWQCMTLESMHLRQLNWLEGAELAERILEEERRVGIDIGGMIFRPL